MQPLQVRRHRGGKRIKGDVLGAVQPYRIARDARQHLVAVHELHHRTGLGGLPWSGVAGAGVLIGAEHAAGNLPVLAHGGIVVALRGAQEHRVARLLRILRRLAKALREIDAVPARDGIGPVGRAAVVARRQVEQPLLPRAVIEPVDAVQVVAAADFLPARGQQLVERYGGLPAEVPRHQIDHSPVAGRFIVGPQRKHHDHVGPKIDRLGVARARDRQVAARAEVAVFPLRRQHLLDPAQGFGDHALVLQHITEIHIAFQPIRDLLPSGRAFAARVHPGIALEFAELAQLRKMPGESAGHQLQLCAKPAFGTNAANRQFDQRTRQQRVAVPLVRGVVAGGGQHRGEAGAVWPLPR